MPRISIVIPARNEAENIGPLLDAIAAVCAPLGPYEVIVVDDGADDGTAGIVRGRMAGMPQLRLVSHGTSAGQSAAIRSGVAAARAPVIATIDGDGQNPPEDLPNVWGPILDAGAPGLVAGQRTGRRDTWSKQAASRIANAIRARALGDGTRDTGCGLKAFRRDDYLALPYFDHMHRYLPALFAREGHAVTLVDVGHRPRRGGHSHYSNLQRGLVGAFDLLGVMWLMRRRKPVAACEIAVPRVGEGPLKAQGGRPNG